jgi:hypothetical protein
MTHSRQERVLLKETLKHVSDNNKEVGGEGIALSQTVAASDPFASHTIEEDGGFPSLQKLLDPFAPIWREATTSQNFLKAVPINRVKRLMEIKFEHNSGSTSSVTAVEEVSRVDKVVRNVPSKHKTSLIITDKRRNKRLEASSEHFGKYP